MKEQAPHTCLIKYNKNWYPIVTLKLPFFFFFCLITTCEVSLSIEGLSFDTCDVLSLGQLDTEKARQRERGAV